MTAYFSRVRLNSTRSGTRRLLSSPQAMHAAVMGSHPDPRASVARVLWRVDLRARHDIELYVVSPCRPDFVGLVEQAGWPTSPVWESTDYEPFLGRLRGGQTWRFRVTANPVQSVKQTSAGNRSRGRVTPHVSVRHQEEWFRSRSSRWGFSLAGESGGDVVRVENRVLTTFRRSSDDRRRQGRVSITRADFAGTLEVTDADLLRSHLVLGMGRAKAYGCGLMTLAPTT